MDWPVGGLIEGRYEVFDIKAHSLGVVYICYDHQTRYPVAIKTYPDSLLEPPVPRAAFLANAQAWQDIGTHPHIVQALAARDVEGKPHVFIEYVEPALAGSTLRYRLLAGQAPAGEAPGILSAVCAAFTHAAERRPDIVHGDVRPENVMMTREDQVKVTDFGMAIAVEDPGAVDIAARAPDGPVSSGILLAESGAPLCSVPYVAPERVVSAAPASALTDIYSFGCLAFEVLTGEYPFVVATVAEMLDAHARTPPRREPLEAADVQPYMVDAVLRCLAKDPSQRPQSFVELAGWLSCPEPVGPPLAPTEVAPLPAPDLALPVARASLRQAEADHDRTPPADEPHVPAPPEPQAEAPGMETPAEDIPAAAAEGSSIAEEGAEAAGNAPQDEAPPAPPISIDELVDLGVQAARAGRLDEAIEHWENALREDWRTPAAHANLGAALAAKGDGRRAHTHLREAMRLAPKRPQAHFNLGRLYHDQGEFDRAAEAYRAALDLDADYGVAYVALGATLEALGRLAEAVEAYTTAAERCDDRRAKERLDALRSHGNG